MIDRIEVTVELTGPLTSEQRAELMKTAGSCPIHRALTHEINVRLCAVESDFNFSIRDMRLKIWVDSKL